MDLTMPRSMPHSIALGRSKPFPFKRKHTVRAFLGLGFLQTVMDSGRQMMVVLTKAGNGVVAHLLAP